MAGQAGKRHKRRPEPLNAQVRRTMRSMPVRDSEPEVRLRRLLHRRGLRYRCHTDSLPGRPDIVFGAARVVVFVDGCFWHCCPQHCVLPRNNRAWWREKLPRNQARDRRTDQALSRQGWLVIHVREHESAEIAAGRVAGHVRRRLAAKVGTVARQLAVSS